VTATTDNNLHVMTRTGLDARRNMFAIRINNVRVGGCYRSQTIISHYSV